MNTFRKFVFIIGSLVPAALFAQNARPPEPGPLSSEINSELPNWLRFSGEERVRTQFIVGENFKAVDDYYLLNRLRLNMDILPTRWLRFHFQAQDARVFGQNTLPAPATQKNAMDLSAGYAQVGSEEGPVTLRAGRQSLNFGEGRLVAEPSWSNVGLAFDAARLTLRYSQLKADLVSGASVKVNPTSDFSLDTPAEHFDGAYGSVGGLVPGGTIEPYIFWRMEHNYKNQEGRYGNLDEKTVGLRWVGVLPAGFDYTSEFAGQSGSWAGDAIGAWMGHWALGNTLPDSRHRPRFFVEFNRASGQTVPKSGTHGTFDPLFWGAHDKFGLTDLFGAGNIVHIRPGFQYTLRPSLMLAAAYDDFWLASAQDGLYVCGKLFAQSFNGAAGTHIGREADFQARWSASRLTQVTVGYGRLFPGEFLEKTTAGVPYNIVFLNLAQLF